MVNRAGVMSRPCHQHRRCGITKSLLTEEREAVLGRAFRLWVRHHPCREESVRVDPQQEFRWEAVVRKLWRQRRRWRVVHLDTDEVVPWALVVPRLWLPLHLLKELAIHLEEGRVLPWELEVRM